MLNAILWLSSIAIVYFMLIRNEAPMWKFLGYVMILAIGLTAYLVSNSYVGVMAVFVCILAFFKGTIEFISEVSN